MQYLVLVKNCPRKTEIKIDSLRIVGSIEEAIEHIAELAAKDQSIASVNEQLWRIYEIFPDRPPKMLRVNEHMCKIFRRVFEKQGLV